MTAAVFGECTLLLVAMTFGILGTRLFASRKPNGNEPEGHWCTPRVLCSVTLVSTGALLVACVAVAILTRSFSGYAQDTEAPQTVASEGLKPPLGTAKTRDIMDKISRGIQVSDSEFIELTSYLNRAVYNVPKLVAHPKVEFNATFPSNAIEKVYSDKDLTDGDKIRILDWIAFPQDSEIPDDIRVTLQMACRGVAVTEEQKNALVAFTRNREKVSPTTDDETPTAPSPAGPPAPEAAPAPPPAPAPET
jgi:hypothetical protein